MTFLKPLRRPLLQAAALLLTLSNAFAATLYVDDDPGSSDQGTLDNPYLLIQTALNVAAPGDVIQVRDGTYNEKLWWTSSGTAGNPITLRNFPGETPVLTGTGITTQTPMIVVSSKSFVVIDGLTLQDNYLQEARGIHVLGEGSNVTIQNCTITQLGFTDDKTTDPANMTPVGQAHGILINGRTAAGYTDIFILNNELSCLVTGNSEALTLAGNVVGFTISGNTIFDTTNIGVDIAGHFSWAVDAGVAPSLNQAREGVVSANTVYGNRRFSNVDAPAGIYVDGGRDVVIECNVVYENGNGISVGCENAGQTAADVVVRNNFIYNNDNHGIVLGSNVADITNCTVRNNTCLKNGSIQSFTSEINLQNSTDGQLSNNILYARTLSHYGIGIFAYTANNLTVSDNILFREGGDLSNLIVAGDGSTAPTDVNTLLVDPLLQNVTLPAPDLHLQVTSPALNAGANADVAAGEEDVDKEARIADTTVDIGADEVPAALPVVYEQPLRAVKYPTFVALRWSTAREVNARHFSVEKTVDSKTWQAIGQVPCGAYDYRFEDRNPSTGTQHYRLRQVDWDGRQAYSSLAAVTWDGAAHSVYPNPSSGTIRITGAFQSWRLLHADGRVSRTGTEPYVDGISPGIYILQLMSASKVYARRIVVE